MDTTKKISTPLQKDKYVPSRSPKSSNTKSATTAKHSKSSQREHILIHIMSLRSTPGSLSWLKTEKVLRRNNFRTTSLQQKYPSSATTSALASLQIAQHTPITPSTQLKIATNIISLMESTQYIPIHICIQIHHVQLPLCTFKL